MGLLNITKLRKLRVSATGKDLALLIVEQAGYSGVCKSSYRELADELDVDPSLVARLVRSLESVGLVHRIGGRKSTALMVNPSFAFRGTPDQHQQAMQEWADIHAPALVRNVA